MEELNKLKQELEKEKQKNISLDSRL